MDPPIMASKEVVEDAYQRGLKDGRREALLGVMDAMRCQARSHPPECGCTDPVFDPIRFKAKGISTEGVEDIIEGISK